MKKMKKFTTNMILLLSCLLICSFTGGKEINLDLKAGKTYKLENISEVTITQNFMGNNIVIKTNMGGVIRYKVNSKNKQNDANITATYESLQYEINMPSMKLSYNSSQIPLKDDKLAQACNKLIGKSFHLILSKTGKVLEISGADEILNTVLSAADTTAQEYNILNSTLKQSFTNDALKSNLEQTYNFYPGKVVAENETWNKNSDFKSTSFSGKWNNTYTLKARNDAQYTIAGNSAFSSDTTAQNVNGAPMKAKFDLNGTSIATIKVNAKDGWIIENSSETKLSGKIHILPSGQLPTGIDIPMEVNGNSICRSVN
ncbi:MAG: DUF6263 family protein [Bacteroidota bacterium]|nr:DUF6263 family protein [Bacteroidota bacterium]